MRPRTYLHAHILVSTELTRSLVLHSASHLRSLLTDDVHVDHRTLTTTTLILSMSRDRVPLPNLHLKRLSLSFNATTLHKLRTVSQALVPLFPASLTSLSLTFLPSIRRSLLSMIAGACPELVVLELSVVERLDDTCCVDCLEESAGCIVHSAIGDRASVSYVEEMAVRISISNRLFYDRSTYQRVLAHQILI